MTKVVNKYTSESYDVYIGRGSPFGNPYIIGIDGNREAVIKKYSDYFHKRLAEDSEFFKLVLELKDKKLACFCHPKPCHGDVIVYFLHPELRKSVDSEWF